MVHHEASTVIVNVNHRSSVINHSSWASKDVGPHVRKYEFDNYWDAKGNRRAGRDDESSRNRKLRTWQKHVFDKVQLAPDCRPLHVTIACQLEL